MPGRFLCIILAFAFGMPAQAAGTEKEAARLFERLRESPPGLHVFLQAMPKGGDLHNHLDGSVYAEDYLAWADEDGFCIDRDTRTLAPPPCGARQVPARGLAARDPVFYQSTIDALSIRNFVPGTGTGEVSGHDHGFATFPRFAAAAARRLADMLAVTRRQAARARVSYLEQIANPSPAFAIGEEAAGKPWPDDLEKAYAAFAPRLPALLDAARREFDAGEAKMRTILGCSTASAEPACAVTVRHLAFVLRMRPPAYVFAQMALGFALAEADPRFVGVNLVGPEDDAVALRDFALHMEMFRFLRARHPQVKLSLHAGELTLGLVPPADLARHVRDSIAIAGARRIGHAYGLPYENDAARTLARMAREGIAIEVNLTSNAVTPGIAGRDHPFHLFRSAGVPLVLGTDDEGVFRIDMTREFVRAALEQGLGYRDLKALARNSIEYSFLAEAEKAALKAKLEADLAAFEAEIVAAGL